MFVLIEALGKAQGEWLEKHFPKGRPEKALTNQALNSIQEIGINFNQSSNSRLIAKEKELVQEAIEDKQGEWLEKHFPSKVKSSYRISRDDVSIKDIDINEHQFKGATNATLKTIKEELQRMQLRS